MRRSMLADAFAHHVWATLQLLDACRELSAEQLNIFVPGTYGSILKTARHLVGSDSWDLYVANGDRGSLVDEEHLDLTALLVAMERNGGGWSRLLQEELDPDAVLREVDDHDGFERRVPLGIQLAQALHHGTDHRSQICTALSALGIEPPAIDVLHFGVHDGRVLEFPPTS